MGTDRADGKGGGRNPSGAKLGNADPAPKLPSPADTREGEHRAGPAASDSQPGKPAHGREPEKLRPPR